MRIPDVIVPLGLNLRLVDGYLPSYVSGLFNVVFGPFVSYSLTFVAGAVLNIVGARSLARRLSPHRLAHVVAAIVFLSAPPIALNIQVGLPALLGIHRAAAVGRRDRRRRRKPSGEATAPGGAAGRRGPPQRLFLVFGGLAYALIVSVAALRQRSWRIPITVAVGSRSSPCRLSSFRACSTTELRRSEPPRPNCSATASCFPLTALDLRGADPVDTVVATPRQLSTGVSIGWSIRRMPSNRRWIRACVARGMWAVPACARPSPDPDLGGRRRHLGPLARAFLKNSVGASSGNMPGSRFRGCRIGSSSRSLHWVACEPHCASAGERNSRGGRRGRAPRDEAAPTIPSDTMGTSAASERALREIGRLAESYQIFHDTPVIGCAGSFAADPWSKLVPLASSDALAKLRCDRTDTDGSPPPSDRRSRSDRKTSRGCAKSSAYGSSSIGRCSGSHARR